MQTPAFFTLLSTIVFSAFTTSVDAEVPYIRMYKPMNGVHMVKINNAADYIIEPVVADSLMSAKDVFEADGKIKILVNAGFFDPINEKTISYVVKNKEVVLNPTENENLMNNEELKPHIDKILNRAEFRVLKCDGKKTFDIAYHNDKVSESCELLHSIQAGPMLDERMDLEKEYFLVKNGDTVLRDSISATKKVARTAIGLKSNDVYLFVVTDKNPMTIEELAALMKKKKMTKAMAFDGGSSTSFENGAISVTSVGDGMGRNVKSFFAVRELEGDNKPTNDKMFR